MLFLVQPGYLQELSQCWQVAMKRVKSLVSWRLNACGPHMNLNSSLFHAKAASIKCQIAWCRSLIAHIVHQLSLVHSRLWLRKSVLELAEAIRAKQSSRGCGPVLWRWVLKQKWSHLFALTWDAVCICISSIDHMHVPSEDKRYLAPSWIQAVTFREHRQKKSITDPCVKSLITYVQMRIPMTVAS